MIYQDMNIQVHFRRLGHEILKDNAARAYLRKMGYAEEEYFGIQVTESRRGEMPQPEIIPYTQEQKNTLESLLERLEKERKKMSLKEVAQLGTVLANLLFYGTVRDVLVRCRDYAEDRGEGLRLRLVLKDAQAARLPWEYVYRQRVAGEKATWSGFLALDPHISIVRHVPMLVPARTITAHRRPLKVYVAFAEPEGIGEDLDQETVRLDIEEALQEQVAAGRIDLTVDEHLKVKNLDRVRGFGIFSFSGHGAYLTADELAYYREKYRLQEDDQTEPQTATQPEETTLRTAQRATLRAGFARRLSWEMETARYKADRDTLRTSFARRQENRPPVEEQAEPEAAIETEEHALRRADRETLRVGFAQRADRAALRKADRNTLTTGFARRQKRQATAPQQTHTEGEAESSQGILVLEKDGGRPHLYPADNLAQRLKRAGVSVVVMDACYSASYTSEYDKWTGMASALVRVGIPAVVGMQYAFSDPAAKAFWPDFYEAVAAGFPLDEAVSAGRLAIMDLEPEPSEENPHEMLTAQNDFGFPALYMRSDDGVLFPALTDAPSGTKP